MGFPPPTPLLAPSPRPPSLGWTLWGRGGGRGPRALKGPLPRIESRQGLPTPSLLGVLAPHGVSQGRTPPSRKTPRTSTPRPPAPSCSRSSQPWCLRTVSGHNPLLFSFLLLFPASFLSLKEPLRMMPCLHPHILCCHTEYGPLGALWVLGLTQPSPPHPTPSGPVFDPILHL